MNDLSASSNVTWLASLTPALARIQAERDAEMSQFRRRHADAVQDCIESRATYLTCKRGAGEENRTGSIWAGRLARLLMLRSEIAEAGYALENIPREAWDIHARGAR